MTQEEKDIVVHGAAVEMMNACINYIDSTVDSEKMLKAMYRYAEMYHANELSKLNLGAVSNNEVACCGNCHLPLDNIEVVPKVQIPDKKYNPLQHDC